MSKLRIPIFFHKEQLAHKPLFEWAFGNKIPHPETTHRAENILSAVKADPSRFDIKEPTKFPLQAIGAVHNKHMVEVFRAAQSLPLDQTFYPSVFPYHRDRSNLDPKNIHHAGAFCFDSGTPLNATTYGAAAWSAACAMEAGKEVASGRSQVSYALCRPPGHHASKDLFGGYCYFNNAAIVAYQLRKSAKKIAILDIDFHHGNGTQVLFYDDPLVLVINLHGNPERFYPYFTGYSSEKGAGAGKGFNINLPLPDGCDGKHYCQVVESDVIPKLKKYNPDALVISAGFDTYVGDPIGSFSLVTEDYHRIGSMICKLGYPTIIVQEGGYEATSLGKNVATFLEAFSG
ncbi:MAG: histone deacetylase family protein [Bdellovibrionota bacterium]